MVNIELTSRVAVRRGRQSDRGGRTGELDPRGTDHGRNAVGTSTGAVLQRHHQVQQHRRHTPRAGKQFLLL